MMYNLDAAPGSASVRMMSKQKLVADMEATLEEPALGSAAPSGANDAGSTTETDSNAPVQLRETWRRQLSFILNSAPTLSDR